MRASVDSVAELVSLNGDLDHLTADAESLTKLIDTRIASYGCPEEVAWNKQFAGEGVGFAFDGRRGAVCRAEEVMSEFVGDREALPCLRFACDEFDSVVGQAGAESPESLDLDDLESDAACDRQHRHGGCRDVVLDKYPPSHFARMSWMRLLGPAGTTWDSQEIVRPRLVIQVDGHSRSAALRALILEARGSVEAESTISVGAPQIRHGRLSADYRLAAVYGTGGRRGPEAVVISACCRDSGVGLPTEEATMDKKERKLFKEIERLRGEDSGLGEKLERYRESRGQYERLVKGREESGPSIPLQRSRRQATAKGRIRGIVDGAS